MKIRIALSAAAFVCALLVPIAQATAVTFAPLGHNMHVTTSSAQFVFGTTSIVCGFGSGAGKVPNPASETIPLTGFTFQNAGGKPCGTTGMGGAEFQAVINPEAKFVLTAISGTAAKLALPGTEFFQFVSGKCVLRMKSDSPAGSWKNGTAQVPTAIPSTLAISAATFFLSPLEKSHEENCPAALITNLKVTTEGKLTTTFNVIDDSQTFVPITIK